MMKFSSQYSSSGATMTGQSTDDIVQDNQHVAKPKGFGYRHVVAILCFLGQSASYMMRMNVSVGVVAMVNSTETSSSSSANSSSSDVCPARESISNEPTYTGGTYNWDEYQQGIILSSFFWGYTVTQFPGGWLASRYGAKWLLCFGLGTTAVLGLLTPVIVQAGGMYAFIAVRVIQGLGEGSVQPATHLILSKWLPPLERSKFGGWVYVGNPLGSVISLIASGPLAASGFLGGWPSLFYVFGCVGVIWCILWAIFIYDSPEDHPRISQEELDYIVVNIRKSKRVQKLKTPWKALMTSIPFWAVIITQTGHGYGIYTLQTELPTYLSTILHYDITDNSVLSAVPYMAMLVMSQISTWIADWLRSRNYLSTKNTRRLMNTIGHWVPAVALVAASYTGCDAGATIFLLSLSVGATGCVYAASQISHLDLSPNFSGIMMGITNTMCNAMGIVAPYVVGVLINDDNTLVQWRIVFFIAAGVFFIDNLIFIIFISGEEQPWNQSFADNEEEIDNSPGSSNRESFSMQK